MKFLNPEMLIVARGSRGKTQKDICEEMSWSQGKASKVEHGLLKLEKGEEVCRLARFLDYPVEFFFQDSSLIGFGTCCEFFRKRSTAPLKEISMLHDSINIRKMQIARLLRGIEFPIEPNFPRLDVDDYCSPEQIAQLVRAHWKLPRGPVRDLIATVEAAGGIVLFEALGMPKIDAVSLLAPTLPPLFFVDTQKPFDRCRFTLAHEIGHIVMHQHPSVNAEEEADRFASEFLMPAREVEVDLRGLTIAKAATQKLKWRVSMQALIRKAKDISVISEARYKSLCVQISQAGYRKNEPNPIQPETPQLLKWLVDQYLVDKGYTISELASAVLCSEDQFHRIFIREEHDRSLRVYG